MESEKTLFSVFGDHDLRELLFAHLNYKEAISLFSVNKRYYDLLKTETGKKSLENKILRTLLSAVVNADWQLAQKIVQARPDLMFTKINGSDLDGSPIFTSPLEYACRVCDEHMIKIFRNSVRQKDWRSFYYIVDFYFSNNRYIEPHGLGASLDLWLKNKINIDDLRAIFCKNNAVLQKKSRIFSVNVLRDIYGTYSYIQQTRRQVIAKEKIDEYWQCIIGYAQRYLVPRHMLKQMCGYDDNKHIHHDWFSHSDFHSDMPTAFKAQGTILFSNIDEIINLRPDYELGKDFAFAYTHGDLRAEPSSKMFLEIGEGHNLWLNPYEDFGVFSRLVYKRTQNIRAMLKDLEYEFGIKTDFDTKFDYDKRHMSFAVAEQKNRCTIL